MTAETPVGSTAGPGLRAAAGVLARPWTLLILGCLGQEPRRFTDLTLALPGISTNLLSERLRTLTRAGVVHRDHSGPLALYVLTEHGARLDSVLTRLEDWGQDLPDPQP